MIEGRDPDDLEIPYTLFERIRIIANQKVIKQRQRQPFAFDLVDNDQQPIIIRLYFFGHYNEAPFELTYPNLRSIPDDEQFYLLYDPTTGKWDKTNHTD